LTVIAGFAVVGDLAGMLLAGGRFVDIEGALEANADD